jgi:hypothetical protein
MSKKDFYAVSYLLCVAFVLTGILAYEMHAVLWGLFMAMQIRVMQRKEPFMVQVLFVLNLVLLYVFKPIFSF